MYPVIKTHCSFTTLTLLEKEKNNELLGYTLLSLNSFFRDKI